VFCYQVFVQREISEMRGPTGAKFCTMVSTRPSSIKLIQNFGEPFPLKFQGPKTCKVKPNFGRLWSSAANISETDKDIQNLIFTLSTAIFPALGETSPEKFGPVTLKISMWTRTKLKRIFWKKHISVPWGCCAPKFLHALENDQVLLAHPPLETAVFFTTFFKGE